MNGSTADEIAKEFADTSIFIREGFYREIATALNSQFGPSIGTVLSSLVFVMIKPDAVACGKTFSILEFLDARSFILQDLSLNFIPKERDFEELYKYNLTLKNSQNQIGSWWLNRKIYTAGPSVVLLIGHRSLIGAELYQALSELKGPSSPLFGKPGQIRYDLSACNKAMNLVHVADDPLSSVREFLCFRPWEALVEVLSRYHGIRGDTAIKDRGRINLESSHLENALPLPQADCDFPSTLFRLRMQLLSAVIHESGALPRQRELMGESFDTSGYTKDRLTRIVSLLRDDLARVPLVLPKLKSTRSKMLLERLLSICDASTWDELCLTSLMTGVEECGLHISDWDRLVLESSAHYIGDFKAALKL